METLLSKWSHFTRFVERNSDLTYEFIRIYLGVGLFAKGIYFAGHLGDVMTLLDHGALQVPNVMIAHYVGLAHLAGGLLIATGLITRFAALIQLPVLIGAIFTVHLREGFFGTSQNLEFAVLVLFLLVLTVVNGGGRLSADAWLARRESLLSHAH